MRFGVWLPSFTWEDDTWVSARELREWCIRADHAGVDIWVIDHLLVAP
jgi:chloramphenicol O-acetyltransferase